MLQAFLIALLLAGPDRLSVQTPGSIAFAPADWWVRVRVERHPENRWLEIEIDGDGFYRRTDIQLEGEGSPRIHQVWFKALPGGCYEIRAILRATGEKGRVLAVASGRRLSVRGVMMEGDPCGETI